MTKTPSEPVFKKIVRDVVREEIKPVEANLENKFLAFKTEILTAFENKAEEILAGVAKMRDEIITSNDQIAGEIKTMREENAISSDKVRVVNELDERVEKLEKIHSSNGHQHHFA
jgi:vacuolar-type H+-ATPase subunit E/Vma4